MESFFPSTASLLRRFVPHIVQRYFPYDLDDRCPEVVVTTTPTATIAMASTTTTTITITIRNPILAVWIILGITVGLYGATMTTTTATRTKRTTNPSVTSWNMAFATFGVMNAVALPLHCLSSPHEHSPTVHPILWMLDCTMTGISSLYLIQGTLELMLAIISTRSRQYTTLQQESPTLTRRYLRCFIDSIVPWFHQNVMRVGCTIILLNLCMSHFVDISIVQLLSDSNHEYEYNNSRAYLSSSLWWKEPLWVELTYLGPLILAMGVCPHGVVLGSWWKHRQSRKRTTTNNSLIGSLIVMGMGVILVVLGVTRVDWFCSHFPTNQWWDVFSAPTLVFAGCDIAFIGLAWWVIIVQNELDTFTDNHQVSKAKVA